MMTGKENGVAFDPCMGWGGRLVGACALDIPKYIGIDLNKSLEKGKKTLEGLHNALDQIGKSDIPLVGELAEVAKGGKGAKMALIALGAAAGKLAYDYFGAGIQASIKASMDVKQSQIDGARAVAEIVGGRLSRITMLNKGSGYSSAIVNISGGSGSGAQAVPVLQSKLGRLRSFYYKTNREKVVVNNDFGIVDYAVGKITINSLRSTAVIENDYYPENYLSMTVLTGTENIYTIRNRILTIDTNDARSIQINAVSE